MKHGAFSSLRNRREFNPTVNELLGQKKQTMLGPGLA
jgi:hypothetical protein